MPEETADQVCRRCGRSVELNRERFQIFEGMHYVCFHYEFEHDPYDPDEECAAGDCVGGHQSPAGSAPRESPADLTNLPDQLTAPYPQSAWDEG